MMNNNTNQTMKNDMKVVGGNLSQTLYNLESKNVVTPSNIFETNYQNLSNLSSVNSMQSGIDSMEKLMPVFINQSHMSTFYQDNPIPLLIQNTKYGVPPPGGPIDCKLPPGHRPGNICKN